MRTFAFLLAVAITLGTSTLARADAGVGVVVVGEASLQPQLNSELANWFPAHGVTITAGALDPESVNAMIDCFVIEDLPCARKIVDAHAKVDTIVFVRVDASPGANNTRDVTLTGYWFDKGQPNAFDERRACEKCTDERARHAAEDLAAALVAAAHHETGRFKLSSTPPGAHVTIDGKPVGVTPVEGDLTPGDHEAVVTLDARTEKRVLAIRRGETTVVDVALPAAVATRPHGSRLLPTLTIAAGGVATIAGIVLIAVDQEPDRTRVPQPPTLRSTRTGGIVVGIAGLAALAGGVYWWLHVSAESAPTVAIDHGGASIGWTGRF